MWRERRIAVGTGVELFTATTGPADAPPLLVIHGGPDWDHTYLRTPLDHLADSHRLVLPDLRACGRSSADAECSPARAADDLVALLDKLAIGQLAVLGFSYGGLIAQRLALAVPDRVTGLILASTSIQPVPDDAYDSWPERNRLASEVHAVWARTDIDGPALTRAAATAAAPVAVWRPASVPEYVRRIEDVHFTANWLKPFRAGTLPSGRPDDSMARLSAAGTPVLLLHGRHDMTFPVVLAEVAGAEIPNAQVVILDEAGHMAHIDQPERWIDAVRTFLLG